LSIDKGGYGYTLEASSPGLLPDTSEPFNIEGFSDTGSMNAERSGHTVTFLVNDKVLIAGGAKSPFLQSAEIYEPSTGSFTNLGNVMTAHRYNHTATTLLNNKVLITGGDALTGTAEIFDPADNSFSPTGSMNHHRSNHGATLLQDGRILIIGASPPWGNTAEIYDPESGTFILVTDTMGEKNRSSHTSTLLPNGKVLIAGGLDFSTAPAVVHVNAYLFNSATEEFTLIGDMPGDPRYGHTATLLNGGTVLIAGGNSGMGNALNTALIYDPYDGPNGSFTLLGTNMNDGHFLHQAALLRDGKVLLMGDTAEIYDPDTQQFQVTGPMALSRQNSAAVVLTDGKILVTGGSAPETNSAEIWNPIEPFPTHVISGTITYNSSGVGGVLLDGLPGYPITNYGGYYEGLVLDGWSDTVTPVKPGYTFTPSYNEYTDVIADIPNQDYIIVPAPEINIKQNTTDIPDDTGSYNFGSHAVGSNTDVTFIIENLGGVELTVGSVSLSGTDAGEFSVFMQPASPVTPSGSTTFVMRFSPTSAGAKTADISIANNDSDENPYNITLNGIGEAVPAPEINIKQNTTDIPDDTGSYNFGSHAVGSNTD
ncbi:choice-of-anchor D domain-containing protein, partial [bacterium]|nr:choice-of-anchor D domain-containing protein [bacterium]